MLTVHDDQPHLDLSGKGINMVERAASVSVAVHKSCRHEVSDDIISSF